MSSTSSRSSRRSLAVVALGATAAFAVACVPAALGTTGAFFTSNGTAALSIGTAAACAHGPDAPYAATLAGSAPTPTFWWRFAEPPGASTVADATGAGNTGNIAGTAPATGVELGAPGLVQCDATGALAQHASPAGTGFVALPTQRTRPGEITVALWVRAQPGATGGLVAFGDAATGPSGATDLVLGLDASSRAAFTVRTTTGAQTVRSSVIDDVSDGDPHLIVASLRATGGGERAASLYVDGTQVDTAGGLTLAPAIDGYWQTGGGDGDAAAAVIDELAVWEGGVLTPAEIESLYRADHW